eukprot:CAMPEP_0184318718 /NCGR_PEP_ID=MMETSP1049-20130417/104304_1 /TAXON_ID=77928 /ORGANISM="Proteomonas sulcata, Strain CCMP704" /LENGTH=86 /DNA_ID=CAMNT_0026638583 /DNA_START=68 /DNA_END=325 /DNA_ORIENTATION=+
MGTIMREMGVNKLDMVRMDVEGAEWDVLQGWIESGILKSVDQLLLEIHMDRALPERYASILSKLGQTMEPFWAAKNNFSPGNIYSN